MQEASGENLDKEAKAKKKKCVCNLMHSRPAPHRLSHTSLMRSPFTCPLECTVRSRCLYSDSTMRRDKEERKKKKKDGKGDKEDSPEPSATEGGEDEDDEVSLL